MAEVSVLIPARNEMFLSKTVENVLSNIRGDTEIIAVCDGYWPDPPVKDDPRVNVIHFTVPVGQRAATNIAAGVSRAKYIMKLDAHCAVDEGFDVKLAAECDYDWTVIPRMYNLHAFDWVCQCGHRNYQGPRPAECEGCKQPGDFKREIIWKPRINRCTDFARMDNMMMFQYWSEYKKRPAAAGDIADTLCHVGASWFTHRGRYWDLDGLDEMHGKWGQVGVEVSCKAWLSGGRQVVNKRTWFSHMFRTKADFGFPYRITVKDQERAREYSRDMWFGNKWPKQVFPLAWMIKKFAPVPGWTDDGRSEAYELGSQSMEMVSAG